jgi:putative ABC transport system substrate-binding protein
VLCDTQGLASARGPLSNAGRTLGLQLTYHELDGPTDIPAAIAAAAAGGAEAIFLPDSTMLIEQRRAIAELATGSRLPVCASTRASVEAGALLSYAARVPDMYRRAASSVDKILKGASPADLPVERPHTFDLVINLKAAEALGLAIPQAVLAQATEIVR